MLVGKKYRGSFEKCLKNYVRDKLQNRDNIDTDRIFITHTVSDADIVRMVKEVLKYFTFKEIIELKLEVQFPAIINTLGILLNKIN